MKKLSYIVSVVLLFVACNNSGTPTYQTSIGDTQFDKAYVKQYGQFYASRGVEQVVFDLDLYSENLQLDSGRIVGSGTNLYISDIFLPNDTKEFLLGSYISDTTAAVYTFLPGVEYDGNISGAYLLNIVDGNLQGYTIFSEGSFQVEQDADSIQISFNLQYEHYGLKKTYKAQFKGIIEYID